MRDAGRDTLNLGHYSSLMTLLSYLNCFFVCRIARSSFRGTRPYVLCDIFCLKAR